MGPAVLRYALPMASRNVGWFLGAAVAIAALASRPQPIAADEHFEVTATTTLPDADSSTLIAMSATGKERTLATIAHVPGATLRGASLGDGRYAIITQTRPARDSSWASSLLIAPSGEHVVDGIFDSSPPVVIDATHVLVARGQAGPALEEQRIDQIQVDEVDLVSHEVTSLYQSTGFLAYPVGRVADETLLVAMGPDSTRLICVNAAGSQRTILDEKYARDAVLIPARHSVVVQTRSPRDPSQWQLIEVPLSGDPPLLIGTSSSYGLAPALVGAHHIAWNPRPGVLQIFDCETRTAIDRPFGNWQLVARAQSGRYVVAHSYSSRGRRAIPAIIDLNTGAESSLSEPRLGRVDVIDVSAVR